MGKLSVTGNATQEYTYDLMLITITFQAYENSPSKAMKKVLLQCEDFLKYLENQGLDISNVQLGENSVNQDYDEDDKDLNVTATREIIVRLPFNMTIINTLMQAMEERKYIADIDTDYELSNEKEIHDELIKRAIKDSKYKAEFIAETLGQKITGVDSIDIRDYLDRNENMVWMAQEIPRELSKNSMSYSNKISAKTVKVSESVEVKWLIGEE